MIFMGVDGCRRGWFCITLGHDTECRYQVVPESDVLVGLVARAELALIDIPIGLVDSGAEGRVCDTEARRMLGRPRASSVFTPPARPALDAESYEEASALNLELTGRGLSRQAWGIAPKIRDIDRLMRSRPELQSKLRECHPEICFQALNRGMPMAHGKKTRAGREDRLSLLASYLPRAQSIVERAGEAFPRTDVARDDIIDALVAAVTAQSGYQRHLTLPEHPPVDDCGLAMEIVYAEGRAAKDGDIRMR